MQNNKHITYINNTAKELINQRQQDDVESVKSFYESIGTRAMNDQIANILAFDKLGVSPLFQISDVYLNDYSRRLIADGVNKLRLIYGQYYKILYDEPILTHIILIDVRQTSNSCCYII